MESFAKKKKLQLQDIEFTYKNKRLTGEEKGIDLGIKENEFIVVSNVKIQKDYEIAKDKMNELTSWGVKGWWWIIPGEDVRIQLIEWDKLLEFIVIRLIAPQFPGEDFQYDEISLGKAIHLINNRPTATKTIHSDKEIRWAHRVRNELVHEINYDAKAAKQDLVKARDVLEATATHILSFYNNENHWVVL